MSKLKKASILVAITVVFLLLLYWYYDSIYLIQERNIPDEIQKKIHNLSTIDLGELIEGEWDTMTIILPYTDRKEIQKNFNININRLANKSIEFRDGQVLCVFCKKGKIQSYFYLPHTLADIDYTRLPNKQPILRNDAVFLPVEKKTNIELQFCSKVN